jgi:hypothetical protein
MDQESTSKNSRRRFLRLMAGAAAACASVTAGKGLISPARAAGKPPLQEGAVNAFITAKPKPEFGRHAQLAHRDLRAYVLEHFTLTPRQKAALQALSAKDIRKIQDAIAASQAKNLPLRVRFVPQPRAMLILAAATDTPERVVKNPLELDVGPVSIGVDISISPFDITIYVKGDC